MYKRQKQNRAVPGGKYYIDGKEFVLRTTGEFENADDVKDTIVRASALGEWIKLKDISKVHSTFEEETIINKTNGTRSISLTIVKKANGDSIFLVDKVKEKIGKYLKNNPDLQVSYIDDNSYYIRRRQNVLVNNGLIGMVLVIISMFTFLSFRTAICLLYTSDAADES